MISRYFPILLLCITFYLNAKAQKQVTVLQVPGIDRYCKIDQGGTSVLPSGRFVTPAGEMIRITHDPLACLFLLTGKRQSRCTMA